MKKLTLLLSLMLMGAFSLLAQRTVVGKVLDDSGDPLPGAHVVVKGTTVGAATDADGNYSIEVPSNGNTLVITFTGFSTQEIVLGPSNVVNVTLAEGVALTETVVTALGVTRDKKQLGYGTAEVGSETLTQGRNTSALDALNARVPGLTVSTASGSPGASTVVNIRGFTSVTGNNQPLFVIDGVPVNNRGNTSSTNALNDLDDFNRSMDFGNQLNDINPNDIEKVTVLKGVAASSLYGSRAANGVILITTKKGSSGGLKVDVSSSYAASQVLRVPHLQNTYGQGWSGLFAYEENGSWGPRADGKLRLWGNVVDNSQLLKPFTIQEDNLRDFYTIGSEWNNSFAISGGNEATRFRFSYSNANADGVIPTDADSYKRHTLSANGEVKMGRFSVGTGINYVRKDQKAVATGQGDDAGAGKVIFQEIIQIPRDHSILDYAKYNDPTDPHSKFYSLDNYFTPYAQNPYWTLYNQGNDYNEDRVYGSLDLGYDLTSNLKLIWRMGGDFSNAFQKDWGNLGIIDDASPNGSANDVVGGVAEITRNNRQINSDLMLQYKRELSTRFDFDFLLGHNVNARYAKTLVSKVTNLDLPGYYSLKNSSITPVTEAIIAERRLVGVYGNASIGFDKWLYLTVGARNDWSSTLPADNNSYFYPSVSLSAVLSDALDLPNDFSFLKVRVAYATAGNDADPYQIFPVYVPGETRAGGFGNILFPFGGLNAYEVANNPGNPLLKPEISKEIEFGVELGFFNRRLNLEANYYNKVTENQIINLLIEPASGSTNQTVNLGQVRNKGIELSLDIIPVRTENFEWGLNFNFTKIDNNVEQLGLDSATSILLNSSYDVDLKAEVGKPLGAIFSPDFKRDSAGHIIVNGTNGLPLTSDEKTYRGSFNPDFSIGFGTTLKYKNWTFSANADFRKGGVFYSYTARLNYFVGNAYNTQFNDRQPWIIPGSVVDNGDGTYSENTQAISRADVFTYYGATDAWQYNHVLDRTFFKLRNVTLSYDIPVNTGNKLNISGARIGVFGRNLFLWTPSGNHFVDPEANTFGTDLKSLYGEFSSGPSVATYGVLLNVTF